MSEKLSVTIKLSRWGAKIVTSLLPIPALLWLVLILKLSHGNEFVSVYENCQGVSGKLSPVVFILNPESISSDRPNRH
jgi:hypothetical protein